MTRARVAVLGIFVADLAFRAPRLPVILVFRLPAARFRRPSRPP